MLLPPGKYNGVSVDALSANGKESWMMLNPQKKPDRHQNQVTSFLGHVQPLQKPLKSVHSILSCHGYIQTTEKKSTTSSLLVITDNTYDDSHDITNCYNYENTNTITTTNTTKNK